MRKLSSLLLIVGVIFVSGCSLSQMIKMAKDQELTVTPSPLEVHADSVPFDVSAKLPPNMLKKNKIYTIKFNYNYGDQKQPVGELEYSYEDYPDAKTTKPEATEHFSFPYRDEMERGDLTLMGVASSLNGKSKETPELPIAQGVITTSRLVRDLQCIGWSDHGYDTSDKMDPVIVNFFFEKGSANLRSSEKTGEEGKKMDAFVAEKNVTKTVTIMGTHSPEGSEAKNTWLAKHRPAVMQDHYMKLLRKYDYKGLADSIKFIIKPVILDWTKFRAVLAASSAVTADQKAKVNKIIDEGSDFVATEKKLQDLDFYNVLMDEVYPLTRVAQAEILAIKERKSDEEILALAKAIVKGEASLDTLTYEELAYAATLTQLPEEKEQIYIQANKKEANSNSTNNLAAVYIYKAVKATNVDEKRNNLNKALEQLEIAKNDEATAEVHLNFAIVYMLRGQTTEARDAINKAEQLPAREATKKCINAVKGTLLIKHAMYEEAIKALSNAEESEGVIYNRSLAHLLNKDFPNAKKGFAALIELTKEDALAYYLMAVTAARQSDETTMADNLAQAVKLDSKLKEKAQKDLEFRNYWDGAKFKDAIN